MEARSALVTSGLGGVDYVVNPYTGCRFGCAYCYATFMSRYVSEPVEEWGNYVYVKRNLVELFERELARIEARAPQPLDLHQLGDRPTRAPRPKYRLTRGVMEVLARELYPGSVSVLTKSPLVLRGHRSLPRATRLRGRADRHQRRGRDLALARGARSAAAQAN